MPDRMTLDRAWELWHEIAPDFHRARRSGQDPVTEAEASGSLVSAEVAHELPAGSLLSDFSAHFETWRVQYSEYVESDISYDEVLEDRYWDLVELADALGVYPEHCPTVPPSKRRPPDLSELNATLRAVYLPGIREALSPTSVLKGINTAS